MSYYNTKNNQQTSKFCEVLENKDISIPLEINTQYRFCVWKGEKKENLPKSSKVPYYLSGNTIKRLDIRRKELWMNLKQAQQLKNTKPVDGIGFILIDSDIFVLDLDDCYSPETDQLSNFAQEIVSFFKDTYIEISPSGRGLHVIGIGRLNLNGRSRSSVNKHVEAYDGSSVRYITITGISFNTVHHVCKYNSTHKSIQWFQKKFFSMNISMNEKYYNSTSDNVLNTQQLVHPVVSQKSSKIDDIVTQIFNSSDKQLFNQLKDGFKIKSSQSEDDWLFCTIVQKHLKTKSLNEAKIILKQMLLKYRYRAKLERPDYLQRTVSKILEIRNINNYKLTKIHEKNQSNLTKCKDISVPAKHIIKICPMVQQIFKMQEYLIKDQCVIQSPRKDSKDYIRIRAGSRLLSMKQYGMYLALIKLFQSKKFHLPSPLESDPFELVYLKIKFSELREILKQSDGSSFRSQVKEVLDYLSTVIISYRKTINNEKLTIEGSSPLLGWYTPKYNKLKFTKKDQQEAVGSLYIGINQLSWQVFERATINYSLLNINVMFGLKSSLLRCLYCHLCSKILPGFNKSKQLSIGSLVKQMWGPTADKKLIKVRTYGVRKACSKLYEIQEHLADFEIKLKYNCILEKHQELLDAIDVRRYKINIMKESTETLIKQAEKTQLVKEQKVHNLAALQQKTKSKARKKRRQSKIDLSEIPF